MNSYPILSLDGGGIRGTLTIALLERLERARPGFLSQVGSVRRHVHRLGPGAIPGLRPVVHRPAQAV
jgi:hypothetical protein